jgi:hypothetical protein
MIWLLEQGTVRIKVVTVVVPEWQWAKSWSPSMVEKPSRCAPSLLQNSCQTLRPPSRSTCSLTRSSIQGLLDMEAAIVTTGHIIRRHLRSGPHPQPLPHFLGTRVSLLPQLPNNNTTTIAERHHRTRTAQRHQTMQTQPRPPSQSWILQHSLEEVLSLPMIRQDVLILLHPHGPLPRQETAAAQPIQPPRVLSVPNMNATGLFWVNTIVTWAYQPIPVEPIVATAVVEAIRLQGPDHRDIWMPTGAHQIIVHGLGAMPSSLPFFFFFFFFFFFNAGFVYSVVGFILRQKVIERANRKGAKRGGECFPGHQAIDSYPELCSSRPPNKLS